LSGPSRDAAGLASRLRRRVGRTPLLRALEQAARDSGARLYLVGGAVRDAALGRPTADLDLVVASRATALVAELRRRFGTRGFRFRKRGVTTFRFHVDGRTVDLVDAARRGLARDLARRDLTINAMAFDLVSGRLVDPERGRADLVARRLRPPRESAFREDALRALRLCRFLAQLPDFRASARTERLAAAAHRALARTPVERVRLELDRLLSGPDPRRGLAALARLGLRGAVLPELEPLERCAAGRERPDVWTHTLAALDVCAARRSVGGVPCPAGEDALVLRWALLLHDVAKPDTLAIGADGRPTFHGHEVLGERRADGILRRLRAPGDRRARVRRLVRHHLRPGLLADAGSPERGLRRLAREAAPDLALLCRHAACDALASGGPEAPARWRRLRGVLRALAGREAALGGAQRPVLVDGRDVMRVLGIEPGPAVGRALEALLVEHEEGRLATREDALAWLAAQASATPERPSGA
jgi:poly(A) polymerase